VLCVLSVPAPLRDREFVLRLFRENWERWFFDPRRWRLAPEGIKGIDIQFFNFSPPQYDLMTLVTLQTGQTLCFYEAILAKTELTQGEAVHGNVQIKNSNIYLVNGYTSPTYMKNLFEAWCQTKMLGSLGFIGHLLQIEGKTNIEIENLRLLGKPGQEVTTNYLYRCGGWAETLKKRIKFDIVIKRFLPRTPLERGNRELAMLKVLPKEIVPRVHGALINRAFKVNGENLVLVLFMDYVQGVEVGKQIWDLMEEISLGKKGGKEAEQKLSDLSLTIKNTVDNVVFPFHQYSFKAWHSKALTVRPKDEYYKWYFREVEQNLTTLKTIGIVNTAEKIRLSKIFKRAWKHLLKDIKATEIHGDLMWRQIMQTREGKYVILDLDQHVKGHAAKDIADLCAANRFIAEDLPSRDKDYMRSLAERFNNLIIETYRKSAAKVGAAWSGNLEAAMLVYLAYRHLHDAAYYAPAWRQAVGPKLRSRYRRYVDFSMEWLDKSLKLLEETLEGAG